MIDDLLSRARIEPLDVEPGATEQAWQEVGRRRRARVRRAQVATGLGLVLVVAVAVLPSLGQESKLAKLDVAGRDSSRRVEFDTPAVELVDPSPADPSGSGIGARQGPAAGDPASPQSATPSPNPAPSSERATAPPAKPPVERTRRNSTVVPCITDWCLIATAAENGDRYELAMDICVPVGARARRFSYPTTQEVDLAVSPGTSADAAAVWTWSKGQRFAPNPHHVDISAGECVTWKTLWDGTDEAGEPLEPGNYRLSVHSPAEQAGDRSTATTTFRVSE